VDPAQPQRSSAEPTDAAYQRLQRLAQLPAAEAEAPLRQALA
jgi:hypothetical protein